MRPAPFPPSPPPTDLAACEGDALLNAVVVALARAAAREAFAASTTVRAAAAQQMAKPARTSS